MPSDPTITDPGLYRVVFENDRVRVLEYRDRHCLYICSVRYNS
jgi:beta-alanine degradation protein BauB